MSDRVKKIASKIENHLKGDKSEISNKIFSEVGKSLIEAGYKAPFKVIAIKKTARKSVYDHYIEMPDGEEKQIKILYEFIDPTLTVADYSVGDTGDFYEGGFLNFIKTIDPITNEPFDWSVLPDEYEEKEQAVKMILQEEGYDDPEKVEGFEIETG